MLANEFKARLIMLGFTQQDIADYIDVSLRTVAYWLNEGCIPHYAVLCLEHAENKQKNDIENNIVK